MLICTRYLYILYYTYEWYDVVFGKNAFIGSMLFILTYFW